MEARASSPVPTACCPATFCHSEKRSDEESAFDVEGHEFTRADCGGDREERAHGAQQPLLDNRASTARLSPAQQFAARINSGPPLNNNGGAGVLARAEA